LCGFSNVSNGYKARSLSHYLCKGEDYFEGKIVTADSSYHSVTNLNKCNEEKLDAYIPDNKFRNRDERFASRMSYRPRSKKFTFSDFHYDANKDEYIYPNGKRLERFVKAGQHKGKLLRGYAMQLFKDI
jgi:hypothetical protein